MRFVKQWGCAVAGGVVCFFLYPVVGQVASILIGLAVALPLYVLIRNDND